MEQLEALQTSSLAILSTLSALQRGVNDLKSRRTSAENAANLASQAAANTATVQPVPIAVRDYTKTIPSTGGQQAAPKAGGHNVNLGGLLRKLDTATLLHAGLNLSPPKVFNRSALMPQHLASQALVHPPAVAAPPPQSDNANIDSVPSGSWSYSHLRHEYYLGFHGSSDEESLFSARPELGPAQEGLWTWKPTNHLFRDMCNYCKYCLFSTDPRLNGSVIRETQKRFKVLELLSRDQ